MEPLTSISTPPSTSTSQPHFHAPHLHLPHIHASHLKFGHIDHVSFEQNAAQAHKEGDRYAIFERKDALARQFRRGRRYLFRRPRPLQYFCGNTLIRDNEERSSTRLELFFDLVFVGLVSVLAEECIENLDGPHLAKYFITFGAAWSIWSHVRELFNSFWNDDLQQKGLVIYVMIMLVIFGNNATKAEEGRHESGARVTAIGTYLLASGGIHGTLFWYSFFAKPYRTQIRVQVLSWMICACLWIAAAFLEKWSAAVAVTVALVFEYSTWAFIASPSFQRLMKLHYSAAVGIDHEIERFHDFFTLVMGEFIISLISRQPAGTGVHGSAGRIVLALVIVSCFQLLYMGGGGSKKITHPIRRSVPCAALWFTLHIPIVSALTICGNSSVKLVMKVDRVEEVVRWIFCGGYSAGMFGLTALAALEKELDAPDELWFPKRVRLAPRLISGVIVVFLPIASQKDGFNSTSLLSITAGLSLATFLWESVASLDGPSSAAYKPPNSETSEQAQSPPDHCTTGTFEVLSEWRGWPRFAEPGLYIRDCTSQRETNTDEERTAYDKGMTG